MHHDEREASHSKELEDLKVAMRKEFDEALENNLNFINSLLEEKK
jgi:hypothetical protein